jgi:rod shape determining protein RodA
MSRPAFRADPGRLSWLDRVIQIPWPLLLLICLLAAVGFAMLFSAAGGNMSPWASRQMARFGVGLSLLFAICLVDLRLWYRFAYVIYAIGMVLLVAVEVVGEVGMGAQRWLDLGIIQLQPSEIMKVALVLTLARFYHARGPDEAARLLYLIPPAVLIALPVVLVLRQPNLGTATMLAGAGAALMFLAGVRLWIFLLGIGGGLAAIPIGWQFLHDYQRQRVLTFLDPTTDPLGAGYHIIQSKIALGSGGIWGKGFLAGTQSHLQFVPEQQTDFIFAVLAEELGLVGVLALLGLIAIILAYGVAIALRSRNHFGRLVAMGVTVSFFFYAFINMAMVMGLIPVVGVPLPLVSYGGTSMLAILIGFGLMMNVYIHRDLVFGRRVEGTA